MISLRQHIEAHTEELFRCAMDAYRAALAAIAEAGTRALPPVAADLQEKLSLLKDSLSDNASADEIAEVRHGVDLELGQWGERATRYSRDKEKEIREIMVAVSAATDALGLRDQRYTNELGGMTTKLQSIAKLPDLSSIRRSVTSSAIELKAAVVRMAEEGERSIAELRAEVAHYRDRLEQSKKREMLDPFTGLVSRLGIESQIEERISWRRLFCLAVLDLDEFKRVNDAYGHIAGDDLLRRFSAELKAQFRSTDVVGRWGGDEFVVIIDSDIEETQARINRVRQWVFGDYKINNGRDIVDVAIKASVGIAAWNGEESAIELMARADARMYSEKKVATISRSSVAKSA